MRAVISATPTRRIRLPVCLRGRIYLQFTPVNRLPAKSIPQLVESTLSGSMRDQLIAEITRRPTNLDPAEQTPTARPAAWGRTDLFGLAAGLDWVLASVFCGVFAMQSYANARMRPLRFGQPFGAEIGLLLVLTGVGLPLAIGVSLRTMLLPLGEAAGGNVPLTWPWLRPVES